MKKGQQMPFEPVASKSVFEKLVPFLVAVIAVFLVGAALVLFTFDVEGLRWYLWFWAAMIVIGSVAGLIALGSHINQKAVESASRVFAANDWVDAQTDVYRLSGGRRGGVEVLPQQQPQPQQLAAPPTTALGTRIELPVPTNSTLKF